MVEIRRSSYCSSNPCEKRKDLVQARIYIQNQHVFLICVDRCESPAGEVACWVFLDFGALVLSKDFGRANDRADSFSTFLK